MTAVLDDYMATLRRHADCQRQHDLKTAEYDVRLGAMLDKHGAKGLEELQAKQAELDKKRRRTLARYLRAKKLFDARLADAVGRMSDE